MAYNTPVFQGWCGYFWVLGILSSMAHAQPFCKYFSFDKTMHLFDFLLDPQWYSGGVQGFGWSYQLSMEQGYMSSVSHTFRCSFYYPSVSIQCWSPCHAMLDWLGHWPWSWNAGSTFTLVYCLHQYLTNCQLKYPPPQGPTLSSRLAWHASQCW